MKFTRKDYEGRIVDTAGLIPENEPVLLLRAQDQNFVAMCQCYRTLLLRHPHADETLLANLDELEKLGRAWKKQKKPDLPLPEPTGD